MLCLCFDGIKPLYFGFISWLLLCVRVACCQQFTNSFAFRSEWFLPHFVRVWRRVDGTTLSVCLEGDSGSRKGEILGKISRLSWFGGPLSVSVNIGTSKSVSSPRWPPNVRYGFAYLFQLRMRGTKHLPTSLYVVILIRYETVLTAANF
jgi:hypothetical protein